MGILTYIKLSAVVAILLALLSNFLYVRHLQHKVSDQQVMIDNQESKIEVLSKNQDATSKIVEGLTKTRRKVANEKQIIEQTVTDPRKFVDFTRKYRMHQVGETDSTRDAKGAGGFKSKIKSKTTTSVD